MSSAADWLRAAGQEGGGVRREDPADGVRLLVLDRPAVLNAFDGATIGRLIAELEQVAAEPDVRALVVTGAEGAFSAGADLNAIDFRGEVAGELEGLMREITRVGALVHELAQPTIAAIDGPVAGGALGIALACDIRLAAPRASFLSPFVHMGLVPDCGATWLMARLMGEGAALEMMLAGRPLDAAGAERAGLVTRVCDDPLVEALELAETLARRPPAAVRATKRLVREAGGGDLPAAIERESVAQAEAFAGAEFAAHFEAWRASRRPD